MIFRLIISVLAFAGLFWGGFTLIKNMSAPQYKVVFTALLFLVLSIVTLAGIVILF